jgi:acyl-[acyl-carrier-protein]-phospholipid O-acyltransferase/long-chain-fatty-acid--[acyl-carrier-protein] ligase
MPEGRTAKIRRRKAANEMRRLMQVAAFAARKRITLFDALLDAAALQGGDRVMLEDINAKPVTYGTIVRNSLALGRLTSKFTQPGENVGVLMPNVNATVFLLFGMWAMRRS